MPQRRLSCWIESFLLAVLGLLGGSAFRPPPCPAADAPPLPPIQAPPGFVVERVAAPPLAEHPVFACFDDRGRLYVAENAGLNLRADDLLKQLPNSINLLEDTNGDGVFDKATVFADKMSFPMGVLYHDGAVYTCSPPSLWKLEDTDGDGVADRRTELVTRFNFTGNAADIHGPFLGPDGRLYWCDGRHGHEIALPDGTVMKGKAARIFRCKLDGTEIETVCGGGMDNPVEIAFTEEGEPFCTANIVVGRPRQDGILYCIDGGVYPREEFVTQLKEFKLTGDLLPMTVNLGWVAPSGLMRYKSESLGKEYRDNFFCAQFNTHKISRHVVTRDGAGFRGTSEDFITSSDPDVHFTDVLEDADGSMLIVDTGGWFRIGCPTSQVAKPEILGGIYRVRRQDAAKVEDAWGTGIVWSKLPMERLVKLLADSRWAVRERAIQELGRRKKAPDRKLMDDLSVQGRRNAVWALGRTQTEEGLRFLLGAAFQWDDRVSQTAIRCLGLNYPQHAYGPLFVALGEGTAPVKREAAAAVSRLSLDGQDRRATVNNLLISLDTKPDRFLEHALISALIRLGDSQTTRVGLTIPGRRPARERAVLIALDQMDGGNLRVEEVLSHLDVTDPELQRTAWQIITARPEWAPAVMSTLRDWLTRPTLPPEKREMVKAALFGFAKDAGLQELVAEALAAAQTATPTRLLLLETLPLVPVEKLPPGWVKALGVCLLTNDEAVVGQAVATLRARHISDFDATLMQLAGDKARAPELRVAAVRAAAPRLQQLDPGVFDFLRARLDRDQPPLARLAAAEALGSSPLSDAQLGALTTDVARAAALELGPLIAGYERSKDPAVARQLLAALDQSPGLTSLSPDGLRQVLKSYPADIQQAAVPVLKKLEVDTEVMKAKLADLEPILAEGDANRGRAVFFGGRAACSACHTVGTEGGKFGPDLSKIATIRTGRDLLEAVVFPSASLVRGFEPYVIVTDDGRLHSGIIGRETADAVYLVNTERQETHIPRAAVESMERGKVSIMPQGLDGQLTRQELADLLAYLQTLK